VGYGSRILGRGLHSSGVKRGLNCRAGKYASTSFGERVLEVIRMLAVGDLDRHFARKTLQLFGSGIWHDNDSQLRFAARHRGAVLEREGADESMQLSADSLDSDTAGRAMHG